MALNITRRTVLQGLAATGATLSSPIAAFASTSKLALYGPPAGPSVTLAHAVASGALSGLADEVSFSAWRNPDELRAGLTSGSIQLSVVPVQAAANLYNRGFPIRLANVMTNGLLYVVSEQEDIASVPDLRGRKLAVPFRGDTPEILLGQLFVHHGVDAANDLEITYTGTPIEAMQMLLAGRVDAALTAEPASTAAVVKGKAKGKKIKRVIDLQAEWGAMTGAAPVLPQAGLALTGTFIEQNEAIIADLLAALSKATEETLANPLVAAKSAAEVLSFPAPLLAASVPHCHLVARPATEARGDIERMLANMSGEGMKKIGGKLPDDAFYL